MTSTSEASPFDKPALRARLRAVRRRLAAEQPQAGAQAAALLPLNALPPFASFSGYVAMGSEMDAGPLISRLVAAGAVAALPFASSREALLAFRAWRPGVALLPDAFGIPSPLEDLGPVEPDLVIAPALAFDRRGGRLGQGAGHYDRTLAALRGRKPVFVLGLAFAGLELDQVPTEPHDQRLDAILTETEFIRVGQGDPVGPEQPRSD